MSQCHDIYETYEAPDPGERVTRPAPAGCDCHDQYPDPADQHRPHCRPRRRRQLVRA
jgi:hypothetical protein